MGKKVKKLKKELNKAKSKLAKQEQKLLSAKFRQNMAEATFPSNLTFQYRGPYNQKENSYSKEDMSVTIPPVPFMAFSVDRLLSYQIPEANQLIEIYDKLRETYYNWMKDYNLLGMLPKGRISFDDYYWCCRSTEILKLIDENTPVAESRDVLNMINIIRIKIAIIKKKNMKNELKHKGE